MPPDGVNIPRSIFNKRFPRGIQDRIHIGFEAEDFGSRRYNKTSFKHNITWAKGGVHVALSRAFADYLLHNQVSANATFLPLACKPHQTILRIGVWCSCNAKLLIISLKILKFSLSADHLHKHSLPDICLVSASFVSRRFRVYAHSQLTTPVDFTVNRSPKS